MMSSEGEFLTVSGTVNTVEDDSFTLDYGDNVIEVEFDDAGLFDDPAESLYPGDRVTVYGEMDDDFLEGRVLEASTVYLENDSTVYGGDQDISPLYFVDPYPTQRMDGTFVSFEGEVRNIRNREFTLASNGSMIQVDTMDLGYNPLDDEGRQQIKRGDRVTVVGSLDDSLFTDTELSATAIYGVNNGSSDRAMASNRSERRNDRYSERRSDRSDRDREDRMNRQDRDRQNRDRMDRDRYSSSSDDNDMWNESEFAAMDRNDDGVVTEREYVRATTNMDNITPAEARRLYAALANGDDELTRMEFLRPSNDAEQLWERALQADDGE